MRVKETSADYRYFPDPDLLPVHTHDLLQEAKALMPELPAARRKRYVADYALTTYDASVLADDLSLGAFFEETAKTGATASPAVKPKPLANWILNDLTAALSASAKAVEDSPITPAALVALVGGDRVRPVEESRARRSLLKCLPPESRRARL